MSLQDRRPLVRSIGLEVEPSLLGVERLLRRVLPRIERGQFFLDMPGNRRLTLEGRHGGPKAHVRIAHWRSFARMLANWDVGFADAYASGEVSSPDIASVLRFAMANAQAAKGLSRLRPPGYWGKLRHALNRNTRRGSRRNIRAHYDLGNNFYRQWLDEGMTYSSALFQSPHQTLEAAQEAKLDRIVELLQLGGGESILEIGCGWGGLAERLLDSADCAVTGVTLSAQQLDFARRRLADHIEAGRCDLRLRDYRDVAGTFDRIVSIEMLEAVGEAYWPVYFQRLRNNLRTGGTAVLQVITINPDRFADYRRSPDFIQKRIFPGGMLPTPDIVVDEAAKAGLRLESREFFGGSYARTLEIWRQKFLQSWPAIAPMGFDDQFKRMWEYYLAYCQVGFEVGAVDVGLYRFGLHG